MSLRSARLILSAALLLAVIAVMPRIVATWYVNEANAFLIDYLTSQPRDVVLGLAQLPWSPSPTSRRALLSYTRALQLDPQNTPASSGLGLLAMVNGDEAIAVNRLQMALTSRPTTASLFLGEALYRSGATQEAALIWRENGAMVGLLNQAGTLRRAGFLDEAAVRAERATLAFPDRIEPWLALADIYRTRLDNEEAIDAFERALLVDPGSVEANLGLAGVLLREPAEPSRARRHVERALQVLATRTDVDGIDETELGSAYTLMAMISVLEGDDSEAIAWNKRVLRLSAYPKGRVCVELARIYQRREEFQEARQWISCALTATAELARKGHTGQAIRDYSLILSIDSGNPEATRELGRLKAETEGEDE